MRKHLRVYLNDKCHFLSLLLIIKGLLFEKGYLMACVAGLWWDQARRMCASPSEVKCNPYDIINSQGSGN